MIRTTKYLSQVTDAEIERIFDAFDCEFAHLIDYDGNDIEPVERGEETIFIRIKDRDKQKMDSIVKSMLVSKGIPCELLNGYSQFIDLYEMSDYYLFKLDIGNDLSDKSERIATKYINFMIKKFGQPYIEDYNRAIKERENMLVENEI